MAKTATATAHANGAAVKATRGKKGEGPLAISYIDADGNTSKRVSEKTIGIRVADKGENVKDFTINELSPAIRHQLVAMALAKRIDTYVRNTAEEDGSNVIELAAGVYDGIKGGTIYSRKEGSGAGAGRPFDFDFWKSIITMTATEKKKPVSEKQLDQFMTKLRAMTPADRKEWIARSKIDKTFNFCWKRAELSKAKESLKKGGAESEVDALDIF